SYTFYDNSIGGFQIFSYSAHYKVLTLERALQKILIGIYLQKQRLVHLNRRIIANYEKNSENSIERMGFHYFF
ncbi:hypothetical protein ACNYMP_08725, partial [Ligilactobacillus salivarius]|uniref:hypothetical protein n=1 Tax=Ligilactobacillus salivarius TaxID=1624 RepID=UPI003AB68F7F